MKKTVCILFTCCILSVICSCKSTKELATHEADYYSKDVDYIVVHAPNKVFELHQFKFKYLTLEGKYIEMQKTKNNAIHVYTNLAINPDSSENVVIEKKTIQKITYDTVKVPWALIITTGSIGLIILGILLNGGVFVWPS